MVSVEIIDYIFKTVGLIALLRIAHNTGQITQKVNFNEKIIGDHEARLRTIENKRVTHFAN
jgi:hypothetical protein